MLSPSWVIRTVKSRTSDIASHTEWPNVREVQPKTMTKPLSDRLEAFVAQQMILLSYSCQWGTNDGTSLRQQSMKTDGNERSTLIPHIITLVISAANTVVFI